MTGCLLDVSAYQDLRIRPLPIRIIDGYRLGPVMHSEPPKVPRKVRCGPPIINMEKVVALRPRGCSITLDDRDCVQARPISSCLPNVEPCA